MLEVRNLTKKYKARNSEAVYALDNVSLSLGDKGMVFLLGKSGSGKSTLLNVMGGLDSFDSGEIIINGKSSERFKERDFDAYRNTYLGFIFQEYNILNEFTVAKNIAVALELQGQKATKERVNKLLELVDLTGYGNRKPNQLSGGQKQRIAIARALIKNPDIIMADEPTGALDSNTGRQVFETLKKLSQQKLVVVVSHDRENAELFADRIIELRDGKIISDTTKHYRAPQKISSNINVINNDIIQIRDTQTLNPQTWALLGQKLKQSGNEIMVISNKEVNREVKKIAKVTDEGNYQVFEQTKSEDIKKEPDKKFRLIKSKMKNKDCIKIGASGLKHKKVRLFFTILLSAIALALFGVSSTMSTFDMTRCMFDTLKDYGVQNTSIYKGEFEKDSTWYDQQTMTQADYTKISTDYGADLIKVMKSNVNLQYADYNFDPLGSSIDDLNFATKKQIETLGYTMKASTKSHWPTSVKECLITDLMFEQYKRYGYQTIDQTNSVKINTIDDIVGKTLQIKEKDYTITGVIDTKFDYNKYKIVFDKNENDPQYYNLMQSLRAAIRGSMHYTIIFDSQYEQDYFELNPYIEFSAKIDDGDGFLNTYFMNNYIGDNLTSNNIIKIKTGQYTTNDIIIDLKTLDIYADFDGTSYRTRQYSYSSNYTYYNDYQEFCTAIIAEIGDTSKLKFKNEEGTKSLNIAGFYFDTDTFSVDIYTRLTYFPAGVSSDFPECGYCYDHFSLVSATNLEKMVNETFKYPREGIGYTIDNSYGDILIQYKSIFDAIIEVFTYLSIGFAVFSSFLIMTFISTSISYKKREIGTLRALGATKKDVYKIFFYESLIICMINLILAVALTIGASMYLNASISGVIGLTMKILSFGLIQGGLMLGISLVVAVIATLLPVRKIAKLKPIDAIHDRK